ncbi:hypothetical protein J2801_002645 [Paraburkholderia phenoliruptrix]|nr:hypothetical protein [Paraburkholderia phenoliruptrix]
MHTEGCQRRRRRDPHQPRISHHCPCLCEEKLSPRMKRHGLGPAAFVLSDEKKKKRAPGRSEVRLEMSNAGRAKTSATMSRRSFAGRTARTVCLSLCFHQLG